MSKKKKKLTKRAQAAMKSNLFASIAIASILLNLFFLTGLVLFNATNSLDESVYEVAYNNLCYDNYDNNLMERIETSSDPEFEQAKFEIYCRTGDFTDYFSNAVESYMNANGYY